MLREFWPPVSVCGLPDLWQKTASSCASHAKNSHTSFFFLQPCCRASDSSDVSAGSIIQKEIDCKRAALWVQTKGPSSTALPPAQSQGSCLSKSRNQAAPTTLPLWTVPPTLWPVCVCSGGSSARCALLSQESAVHLTLPKGLPSPTLSLLQLLAHTASTSEGSPAAQGTSSCSKPGYGSLPLRAPGILCLKNHIFPNMSVPLMISCVNT